MFLPRGGLVMSLVLIPCYGKADCDPVPGYITPGSGVVGRMISIVDIRYRMSNLLAEEFFLCWDVVSFFFIVISQKEGIEEKKIN